MWQEFDTDGNTISQVKSREKDHIDDAAWTFICFFFFYRFTQFQIFFPQEIVLSTMGCNGLCLPVSINNHNIFIDISKSQPNLKNFLTKTFF